MSPSRDGPRPGTPVRGSHSGVPVMALLDLLGRRWALRILWELWQAPGQTFRALQTSCGGISSSVLAGRLGELAGAGVVERDASGYALTVRGRELVADLAPLTAWANRWARETQGG